jgi:hypothetical protein
MFVWWLASGRGQSSVEGCSVGKWPRAFTVLLSLALIDSMAFVVQATFLISTSKARNGMNSAHALVHSRMMAGYRLSHLSEKSANRSSAAVSDGAV